MGLGKVVGKSILKGLRDTGIVLGTVAGTAALVAGSNPEVWAPVAGAIGGTGGAAVLVLAPIFMKSLLDAWKHKDKA
jgi:hypothetical protein